MRHVQPPLNFIPPKFNPLVLYCLQGLLPLLLRVRTRPWLTAKIANVEANNLEILADLYRQFQTGQTRFLIAFRHPEVDDPLPMLYVLSRLLPKAARQHSIPLRLPLHSHFVYDRGMPLWGGAWLGWLLSRLGGVPVRRGKRVDLSAMRVIRHLLMDGNLPMAIAPEGGNNGCSDRIGPLEQGLAKLAMWCLRDLHAAGRSERVAIVPIGIQYRYITPSWIRLDRLLRQLEQDFGLPVKKNEGTFSKQNPSEEFAIRLERLQTQFVACLEDFYCHFYPNAFGQTQANLLGPNPEPQQCSERNTTRHLTTLLDTALRVGEQTFGIPSEGNLVHRCRRLEEAGWIRIFQRTEPESSSLEHTRLGLADWVATEAALQMRHMRLVESLVALTETPIPHAPTFEQLAERALLLFDAGERIQGKGVPLRPQLGWRQAKIKVGYPIWVNDYRSGKDRNRISKEIVAELTQKLRTSMESLLG